MFSIIDKHSFSQRIVDHWNKLPDDVVSAATISTFKRRLDTWMDTGQIWALKADSVTSQLTVTVTVFLTDSINGCAVADF